MNRPLTSTPVETNPPLRPLRSRSGDRSLRGIRVPYPGLEKVVSTIRTMIEHYRGEEFVRETALQLTSSIPVNPRTGHPDRRNFDQIASAIYNFIIRTIHYVRDQHGIERLQTPDATLKLRTGDCDDMVILGGSLLESLGVPTRLKLVGERKGAFSHIYLEYLAGGQWKPFDPTLALQAGIGAGMEQLASQRTVPISDNRGFLKKKTIPGLPLSPN